MVLSDEVKASSLHEEVFPLDLALFLHRVESLFLIQPN
mgnify:CR=1 FL=1